MYGVGLRTLLIAAIVSFGLTPVVIRLGRRFGALDKPGPRKVHKQPIPRIGGVAIFAGFMAAIVYAGFASGYLASGAHPRLGYWITLGTAAAGVFLLGLVDDLVGVAFQWKFLFQIAAAVAVWIGGFRIGILSHPLAAQSLNVGILSLPLTVLWIVGVTNAINLIDGLDGLAAGTALITTIAVAAVALKMGQPGVVGVSVALVGSLLGFLWFNFNPARVFLGDSGSTFLGFVLSVASIHGSQKGPTAVAVFAPLLVLGLPILDTSLAIARRLYRVGSEGLRSDEGLAYIWRNAHRVFLPDRLHLHHRLLDIGMSHRGAVISLYAVVAVLALAALAIVVVNSLWLALLLLAVLAVSMSVLVALVVRRNRGGPRGGDRRPVLASELSSAGAPRIVGEG
ncbi:MAG: undecaprenyl/decaprenyl-phosphate alpha-N-acetylglucosaminyl 1-phosphate transferase [Acidobacteriia bacterium]|nr:undecaprenyl/decaprenyl-phosphate alpha-N-acetylglucosaminyl 1-phosphate transferase [Terriglobia bacterium]